MANILARTFIGAATAAVLLTATPQAHAFLLAYEGFDYTPGSDLTGQNGGFGWTTPWGVNSSGVTVAGNTPGDVAVANSLTYIDSANRMLFTSGGAGFYSGVGGTSSPFRDFTGMGGEAGTTLWVSFLAQRAGPTTNNTGTPFNPYPRAANVSLFENNSERLAIGTGSGAVSNMVSLLPAGSTGNIRQSNDDFALVSLAVVRIDYGADNNDTAYLWVNPTLGLNNEPLISIADAVTNNFNFNFNRIRPFAGNTDVNNSRPYAELYVDELRIGTTWQDVTPFITVIPEPSVASLAVIGGLLLWRVTRRRD